MSRKPIPLLCAVVVTALLGGVLDGSALAQSRSNEPIVLNESSSCGQPAGILPPMADIVDPDAYRYLSTTQEVRGPWASLLGRTHADVTGALMWWEVPMSGGRLVKVHEAALPAFQEAARLLAIEQSNGNYYSVRLSSTFAWRRVTGSYRYSHHAFGTTLDVNWDVNPQIFGEPPASRSAYTDIPGWFVDAFREAGFCWGGDWSTSKDPMHFSWKGPQSTPGYPGTDTHYGPDSTAGDFKGVDRVIDPGFGPERVTDDYRVGDFTRDGAADIIRIRQSGNQAISLQVASASHNYKRCGVFEIQTKPMPFLPLQMGMADVDGDSRSDIWLAGDASGSLQVAVARYADGYAAWTTVVTGATTANADLVRFADYDQNRSIDLIALELRESDVRARVYADAMNWSTKIKDKTVAINPSVYSQIDIADRGGDGVPDIIAMNPGGSSLKYFSGSSGWANVHNVSADVPSDAVVVQLADWDGDGRDDIYAVTAEGTTDVLTGGNDVDDPTFWFLPVNWECLPVTFPALPFDFNGDGYADPTASAPFEDVGLVVDAGEVFVAGGGSSLVAGGFASSWSQTTPGILGGSEKRDFYGESTASADFNGDGYADLAIGVPGEGLSGLSDNGAVSILFGTESGLTEMSDQSWNQDSAGVGGLAESGDQFGKSLAAGDFNGDGRVDLAVGVPGEDIGSRDSAGYVDILLGHRWSGMKGSFGFHQNSPGVAGAAEAGDEFGSVLATGDFNGDGFADLAVGTPGEAVGTRENAGTVSIFYGGSSGLATTGSDSFHAGQVGVAAQLEARAEFGAALGTGDIDGDGYDDLVIGAPGSDDAGAVFVLSGSSSGLVASPWPAIRQGSAGIGGAAEVGDRLGAAVGVGDFNGDGFWDIAIGVPGEDIGSVVDAGMVSFVPGSGAGPDQGAARGASQVKATIWGNPESSDGFGSSVRIADYDHDSADDVIVGVPGEGLSGVDDAGVVVIVPGTINGNLVNLARSMILYQGLRLPGVLETGDMLQ